MKFDGSPGEKTILSFKLANGVGWLTNHRLIIQQETHNPRPAGDFTCATFFSFSVNITFRASVTGAAQR